MSEIFTVALRNLSHQKTRTMLTLLGVIVGIAAVVALISLSQGMNASIEERLEKLGSNKVLIVPKMSARGFGPPVGVQTLTEKDLDAVKSVREVDIAVPILFKSMPVNFGSEAFSATIYGVPAEDGERFFSDIQAYETDEGRFFRGTEKNVIVLGSRVPGSFTKELRIGSKVEILGRELRVIGILKPTGSTQDDTALIMPIDALREISGSGKEISVIFTRVFGDARGAAQKIEDELERVHNEKLFVAITTEQLITQLQSVFAIMSIVLVGIAGISLLVAGFGIMNTMLMAVLERTREIGVMKAMGATNHRIMALFLIESSAVGLIGGAIGVTIGYLLSFGLSGIAVNFIGLSLHIEIDPLLVAGVVAFSTIVGTISGTYPAYRAARLDPVKALRYE